jgi:hypothetical protein
MEFSKVKNKPCNEIMSYLTCVYLDNSVDDNGQNFPVIGGSILIRNACRLDSSRGPRLVDLVEGGDDPNDTFVVEQNANLFDGNYFQMRQNPLYNSDQDLSDGRGLAEEDDANRNDTTDDSNG